MKALSALTIRPLLDRDGADILMINAESRPSVVALDRIELDRLRALSDLHRVAADEGGAVVAYLLVFATDSAYDGEEFRYFLAHLPGPFLYVDQIAIAPARRGTGLGRRLYQSLRELAVARRADWLCCEVNSEPPNPASLAFHLRLGFTAVGIGDTLDGRRVTYLARKL